MLIRDVAHLQEVVEKEGNHKTFIYKGYDCEIERMPHMGHLCGYIHIPRGHALYRKDYSDIDAKYDYNLPSHGGLTYSRLDSNKGTWKVGFDAAHVGDIVPVTYERLGRSVEYAEYRTMEHIEETIKEMIEFIEAQK